MFPKCGPRFIGALAYAADKHHPQVRKSDFGASPDYSRDIPYISHLLAVAAIVLEAGGNEDEAIAGLLHDAIEDQGVEREEIEARFGARVAHIVDACSEHWDRTAKKPDWQVRKTAHLARLREEGPSVLLVTAADKIHNGESILHDIAVQGPAVWSRFNSTPDRILWYYTEVSHVVSEGLGVETYAAIRLANVVSELRLRTDALLSQTS